MDCEKVDVSSVQPRSSGELPDRVDWSFEMGLLRFQVGTSRDAASGTGAEGEGVGQGASLHTGHQVWLGRRDRWTSERAARGRCWA